MYWSPATTFRPKAHANTVAKSRPVVLAARIIGSTSREIIPNSSSSAPNVTAPMISHTVSNMLAIPPLDTSRSTSSTPESIWKPVAIACHTALIDSTTTPPPSSANPCTTSGCSTAAHSPAKRVAAMRASEAGTLRIESTASRTSGSRFSGRDVVHVGDRRELDVLGHDGAVGPSHQAEHDEAHHGQGERRHRRPHLPLDVLVDVDAHHLRGQDRGLGQRRQLVAEVRPRDDGTGGDLGRDVEGDGDADQAHADGAGGRPRAADAEGDDPADQGRGRVVPAGGEQLDAVVDEGGDRARQVPHADQGTHGEQDEDGAGHRRQRALGRLLHLLERAAVLHGDEGRHHGAQHQRHLDGPVERVEPEQGDRPADQDREGDEGKDRVEQGGLAWGRGGSLVAELGGAHARIVVAAPSLRRHPARVVASGARRRAPGNAGPGRGVPTVRLIRQLHDAPDLRRTPCSSASSPSAT